MEIRKDGEYVIINDIKIPGYIADDSCKDCSQKLIYYEDYDAYFCANCNKWKESRCLDFFCKFCKKRPKKPLLNLIARQ